MLFVLMGRAFSIAKYIFLFEIFSFCLTNPISSEQSTEIISTLSEQTSIDQLPWSSTDISSEPISQDLLQNISQNYSLSALKSNLSSLFFNFVRTLYKQPSRDSENLFKRKKPKRLSNQRLNFLFKSKKRAGIVKSESSEVSDPGAHSRSNVQEEAQFSSLLTRKKYTIT